MIKLKVIAMSKSGKSALACAQLTDGVFTTDLAVGNIRVSQPLEIGSIHQTNFKTCAIKEQTSDEDGTVFSWLVLGL